ncbi:Ferredoxin subunit of nitrite reductase or a ring-hydroxylating dioxygenase [Haladaptatus litoreus]|uniref:Ferredoxin subunit of nitrite reductase or a ring-hydroxylating dioxygenase n=1 Tax=Haladaptatus litoreus TaxID=553468 RepID=A0A1N6WKV7_9EURY|nr:Rieske 2Fe-2S domain-containing protein [Haladaptatus litoreus]SIQ90640.1 Ferredoxin subunit of nitrite reductase or a ring-hydroxylating dioxygenase [Haladaptatus litoreus]
MDENSRIAALSELPDDSTFLFTIRDGFDEEEAVLVTQDEDVLAWKNYCQHWTDVRLDKGNGATMRDGELVCGKHGALFEADSGVCSYGPCEDAVLDSVDVTVEDGAVYLTDPDYEFVQQGSSIEYDLSSNRSLGFE